METFASVAEDTDRAFTTYDSTDKMSSPDTLDPEAHETNADFFKRSNAEYYSAA